MICSLPMGKAETSSPVAKQQSLGSRLEVPQARNGLKMLMISFFDVKC